MEGEGEAREETRLSRGLHLRRKGCAFGRRAPSYGEKHATHARTHAGRQARIRDIMNVKLNDAPSRARGASREIAFALFSRL